MVRNKLALSLVIITAFVRITSAQTLIKPVSSASPDSGVTANVEFGGTSDSDGQVYELNSSVGYDFNPHFGVAIGTPVYFINPSSSAGGTSSSGLGDPYLALLLRYPGSVLNFGSTLAGAAPVGDSKKGLSTGRATFDWNNRFEHGFSNLTPFVEIGIANTTPDSLNFLRPYTTLGFNTHIKGGAGHDVWKFISVEASGYDIIPSGQQTVFSRVNQGQGTGGTVHHGRVFEGNQQTKGGASIAQDDGFSAAVDASPGRVLDMELAYTRSLVYDLNSVSFSIDVNLGHLYRRNQM